MERVAIFLTVVVLASGATSAEDKFGPHYEHLKCYQQLIGTWKYEGPILEDIEVICRT